MAPTGSHFVRGGLASAMWLRLEAHHRRSAHAAHRTATPIQERIRVREVAAILGITARTVQAMAGRGALPSAVKVGRQWTFNEAAVRQWLVDEELRQMRSRASPALSRRDRAPHNLAPLATVAVM